MDRNGVPVKRYSPHVAPSSLAETIESLLGDEDGGDEQGVVVET